MKIRIAGISLMQRVSSFSFFSTAGESIPIEDVDAKVVQIYRDDMREKSQEIFIPFMRLLKRKKVHFCYILSYQVWDFLK